MAQITTVYTYALNSSQKDFTIPFEYLARRFITVTLIGSTRKVLTLTTDYRFTSTTGIQTTKAWGVGDGFTYIEIRRTTSATDRLVSFADGSILRATDLNLSQIQTMHVAEEARNAVTDTLGVDANGMLDARARRIVNLADAVDGGDAVTLRQQIAWGQSAYNSAQAALQQAQAAALSASQALTSNQQSAGNASASLTSANASQASNVAAYQAYQSAVQQASAAGTSAVNAKTSETNAKTSETNAAGSASAAAGSAASAAVESAKLGNYNAIASTIEAADASSGTVQFKGNVGARGTVTARGDNEASFQFAKGDGSGSLRFVRIANRTLLLYDDLPSSGSARYRVQWDEAGTMTNNGAATINGALMANGNVIVKGGLVGIWAASPTANAHTWYYNSDGTSRGVTYMEPSGAWRIQSNGRDQVTVDGSGILTCYNNIGSAGNLTAQGYTWAAGRVYSGQGNSFLETNGNVSGAVWGGFLSTFLSTYYQQIGNLMAQIAASMTADVIGSIATMQNVSGVNYGLNSVTAGGNLRYSSHNAPSGTAGSGSWRSLSYANNGGVSNWIRYA